MTIHTPDEELHTRIQCGFPAVIIVLLFIAAISRFAVIDSQSYWYDETVTAALARNSVSDLAIGTVKDNGNPPLFWLIAKYWALVFSDSDISLRSLSAVCSIAASLILGLFLRDRLGNRTALVFFGISALSLYSIELATEARCFSFVALLTAISIRCFCHWQASPSLLAGISLSLVTTLLCYTHYYGAFVPLSQGASLALISSTRRLLPTWIGLMIFAFILYLPWMPAFLQQFGLKGNLGRYQESWPMQFAALPMVWAFGRSLAWRESGLPLLAITEVAAIILVWVPALFGAIQLVRDKEHKPLAMQLLLLCILPVVVPAALAVAGFPLFSTRYPISGWLAFLALVAYGLAKCHCRYYANISAVVGIVALSLIALARYATIPMKDDWRTAEQLVAGELAEDDLVICDSDIEVVPYLHYAQRNHTVPHRMLGTVELSVSPPEVVAVQYVDGKRLDGQPSPASGWITDSKHVWVLLCVPTGSATDYDTLLGKFGFVRTSKRVVKPRTDVLLYDKMDTQ